MYLNEGALNKIALGGIVGGLGAAGYLADDIHGVSGAGDLLHGMGIGGGAGAAAGGALAFAAGGKTSQNTINTRNTQRRNISSTPKGPGVNFGKGLR